VSTKGMSGVGQKWAFIWLISAGASSAQLPFINRRINGS